MKKTSVILIIIVILTKIISVIKDMTLANYYGISEVTDVYVVSITISTLFFAFFLSAIKSSFIPKYSEILKNDSESNANKFANSILSLIILVMVLLIGLVLIFTKQIVNIIAPGFNNELIELTIYFTRISIFSILFTAVFSVFSGLLNMNNIFLAPALATIPMQIVLIFTIIISKNSSIYLLPWGYVFASFLHLIFILPFLKKIKYSFKPKINFTDNHTKSFLITIMPIFLSVALSDLSKIIDKALASTFHIGAISTLDYAHKLTGIVESIVVLSILTVTFPALSKFAYSNIDKFKSKFIETFKLITLIAVPSMVGFILMNDEFVDLVYGRGEFDSGAVLTTARVLMFYSPSILFFSLRALYIRSFYSFGKTKITLYNTIITITTNIIINILLFYFTSLGVYGLAIAATITSFVSLVHISVSLRRFLGNIFENRDFLVLFKILVSALIMGMVLILFKNFITTNVLLIDVILHTMLSIVIYYLLLLALKNQDAIYLLNFFFHRKK